MYTIATWVTLIARVIAANISIWSLLDWQVLKKKGEPPNRLGLGT